MARKFIQRFIPDPTWIKKQRSLRFLGSWLHDPNIWHLNRRSVALGTFIGLFSAFIPLPTQMIFAAFFAVICRANLPVSITLVWISNPITMPPIFYFCYKVGAAILEVPAVQFEFELSWYWIGRELAASWQPFLLGCFVSGLFFGLLGSALVRWAWRRHTLQRWHQRRLRRQQ